MDEVLADEDFDISFVTAIEDTILVHLGQAHVPEQHLVKLLNILVSGTHHQFETYSITSPPFSPKIVRNMSVTQTDAPPVPEKKPEKLVYFRERFAIACKALLFRICSSDKPGKFPLIKKKIVSKG